MSGSVHASRDSSDAASAPATANLPNGEEPGAELVRAFSDAWARGECRSVEQFLARRGELQLGAAAGVQLVCEEICLRQETGEAVDPAEIPGRFPQWRAELELLMACHGLFQDEPQADFPASGEEVGEFRLLDELGRGATGRVFLATQPSLSDRPVVVKFTSFEAAEHLSLARLQHTGIAPLYLVQDFPERGLRALCMPYLGGASLDALLAEIGERPPAARSGLALVEALGRLRGRLPDAATSERPALELLASLSYVQAVCWIGACLADALHYAHQRGLVHLDVKPSNVLLAGDGQPMLLDFHLARGPLKPSSASHEWIGGTQGYMSPEQAAAVAAIRAVEAIPAGVDARSDVYSLGVVLYEMLGGPQSAAETLGRRRPIRSANAAVSRGLADLIEKCLARDPAARYRDAAALADDLRRHLADLPLAGVPNRNLAERWQKWRRRKPQELARLLAAVVAVVAGIGGAIAYSGRQARDAQVDLRAAEKLLARGEFPAAVDRLRAGAARLGRMPGNAALKASFSDRLAAAQQRQLAEDLHRLVDQLRFLDSGVELSPGRIAEIEQGCPKIWSAREKLLARFSEGDEDADGDEQTRDDLLDLGILWASMKFRAAQRADVPRAKAEARAVLDEAARTFGASFALDQERAAYSLNEAERDRQPPADAQPGDAEARSVWEHDALGRFWLRAGRLEAAEREFALALAKAPQAFWPNYYAGVCAFRAGRFEQALTAFSVCVALAPKSAECFYNRGLAHAALEQFDDAAADYKAALKLDPQLTAARASLLRIEERSALRNRP